MSVPVEPSSDNRILFGSVDDTPIGDFVAEKPPDGVSETLRSRGRGNLQSRFSIHKRIPNRQTPLNGRFHRSNHATGAAHFFRVQCSPVQLANCLSLATRSRLRLQLQSRTKWTFSTQTVRPVGSTAESGLESCWLPLRNLAAKAYESGFASLPPHHRRRLVPFRRARRGECGDVRVRPQSAGSLEFVPTRRVAVRDAAPLLSEFDFDRHDVQDEVPRLPVLHPFLPCSSHL